MQEITQEIITAVRELFIVRDDCYPRQLSNVNEYIVIKQGFSDEIIKKHLLGQITIGSFQIDPITNKVKWICFDFDGNLDTEFKKAKQLFLCLKERGYNPLLEFSGRRGYHVWLFVEPVDASIARKFAYEISNEIEVSDIFPKQDKIESTGFGGQVKIPLGVHRVSYKRSYFFDKNLLEVSQENSNEFLVNLNSRKRDVVKIDNLKNFS